MVQWRIYYDDGSTFDSTQGEPEDALSYGVLCIVEPDEDCGRTVLHGWDWYYFHPVEKKWWGADIWGLTDCLLRNRPNSAWKQGCSVGVTTWKRILQEATDDQDFPRKSAKRRLERPESVK